jgi:hypothetical protein
MIFAWTKKPNLTVEVSGADLVVTLPGTGCRIAYTKSEDNKLIASSFSASRVPEEKRKITFPQFLALAWRAANDKAKEIGWIA